MQPNVDEIVRTVLARLKTAGELPSRGASAELIWEGRLLTVADLREQLTGVQKLSVRRGSILTPAVRDLLKERKIALTWRAEAANDVKTVRVSLIVGVAETSYCPAGLCGELRKRGVVLEQLARTGITQVTGELSDHVAKNGRAAILFTSQPAVAVCLANRVRGVRGITGETRGGIESAIRTTGANFVAIDPTGRGTWEVKQIVERFVGGSPWAVPDSLKT